MYFSLKNNYFKLIMIMLAGTGRRIMGVYNAKETVEDTDANVHSTGKYSQLNKYVSCKYFVPQLSCTGH